MALSDFDFGDIQGLVRFAYAHLADARFYLLRIADAGAARAWLAAHLPAGSARQAAPRGGAGPEALSITNAVKETPPDHALQVAFTAEGLRRMGVDESIVNGFSAEFVGGMVQESRSRRLGDIEENAPKHWSWGWPDQPERMPHLVVLLYAEAGRLQQWEARVHDAAWEAAQVKQFSELAKHYTLN